MFGRGLLFCIALLAASPAFAATRDVVVAPAAEKRIALVIGNAAYKNATPLVNPPNDARLMAQTLTGLGFQIVGGKPLIDADKQSIEQAIRAFGRALQGGAVGLFYYSGHGVQIKGANYLIPVTANVNSEADVKYELVDAGYVLDEMSNAGNRLNIVILDACRNNPFGGRGLRAVGSGLAQITAPAGTIISYATQPGNVASDGAAGNSPYTKALASAVKTPGRDIFATFNTVGLTVKQATGGQQQPWLATSPIEGDFYFAGLPANSPTPQIAQPAPVPAFDPAAAELSFWDTIKTSTDPADFKAYLDQYPKGRFVALARTRAAAKSAPVQQQVATVTPVTPNVVKPPAPGSRDPGTKFRDCDNCPEMVVIPAGSFMMGSSEAERRSFNNEGPQHRVNVPAFAAGVYPITFDQWDACVKDGGCAGYRPGDSRWGRGNRPAINVNWQDAQSYVTWVNRHVRAAAQVSTGSARGPYRLLTEAEWEYAARAGTTTLYYWGNNIGSTHANCNGCGSRWDHDQTSPVGSFAPNPFGLYDMAGNVWQWVEDCYHHDGYTGAPTDGSAWTSSECIARVLRGGGWIDPADNLRSARLVGHPPDDRAYHVGFRIARDLN